MHKEWRHRKFSLWPALLGLLLASSSCANTQSDLDESLPVVVSTTTIWADVVSNVTCGDLVNVSSVVPAGADPHSFEPSLADRGQMDSAQLLVANGLGLEAGLEDTLAASVENGATLIALGPLMSPVDGDPHVWLDPIRVSNVLGELSDAIVANTNVDSVQADACLFAYQKEVLELDLQIEAILASIPESRRKLVTSHDSLEYFASRYGFEIVGSIIPSTSGLGEASPADLQELVALIRSENVPAIFTEAQASADVAEALAEQLPGVQIIQLDTGSLGGAGSSYLELMATNAELIAQGLS